MTENKDTMINIDEMLDDMKFSEDVNFEAMIEKKINKRIRKIALKTVLTVLIVISLVFLGISPIMDLIFTSPVRLDSDTVYDEDGSIVSHSTLYNVLDAWIETQIPYCELDYLDIKREGFGSYEIKIHYFDLFDLKKKTIVGAAPNAVLRMDRGKMTIDEDPSYQLLYRSNILSKEFEEDLSHERKVIEGLPESSHMCAVIHTKDPIDIVKLRDENRDGFWIDWAEVYTEGSEFRGGINLSHIVGTDPEYKIRTMSKAELKEYYLSRIQLLVDYWDVWKELGLAYGDKDGMSYLYSTEEASEMIEKERATDTFETEYFCVDATRNALLDYIDNNDVASVEVINAELIGW